MIRIIIKMWEICRWGRHESRIRIRARGISPGIFAKRRWWNRSLRSHGDCRVSPVDRSTPRSRSSTKPQSGRSAGGHTPVDEGFSPIPVCAIKHNRGKSRNLLGFSRKKMPLQCHVRDWKRFYFSTSWKNPAVTCVFEIGGIYCLRKIEFYYNYFNFFFIMKISLKIAKCDCAKSLIKRIIISLLAFLDLSTDTFFYFLLY